MSVHPQAPLESARKPVTLPRLREMRTKGEAIAMLTCYDASFARLLDASGVDCVLVGDSLGMVIQGRQDTLPVTLDEMAYHTRCVARGLDAAWLIADLPFGSYQAGPTQALASAVTLMQAGAKMVKLEGGAWLAPTVAFLVERGIPVCAHLGLTPQSVHALGGYRVQGRSDEDAGRLLADARALDAAGAAMLVAASLAPAAFGMGWVYLAGAALGGAHLLHRTAQLALAPSRRSAMVSFHASLAQLTLLLVAAMADAALHA